MKLFFSSYTLLMLLSANLLSSAVANSDAAETSVSSSSLRASSRVTQENNVVNCVGFDFDSLAFPTPESNGEPVLVCDSLQDSIDAGTGPNSIVIPLFNKCCGNRDGTSADDCCACSINPPGKMGDFFTLNKIRKVNPLTRTCVEP